MSKTLNNQEIITVIPLHKELSIGTIKGILELAKISEKEFRKKA